MSNKDNNEPKSWNLHIQSSKGVTADAWKYAIELFNSIIDRLEKKIDILKEENSKIKKELVDLRESVQYHSDNVVEVYKKLEDIDSRVEEVKLDEITEDFFTKTKKKLADLEDRSGRKNLHFDGFQEETNETKVKA